MTPAARVQAAIDVLDQVFGGVPAEKALTAWARGARYAGSKDRAAVRDHVFQAIRCRDSYAARGGGLTGRQVMIGQIRTENGDLEALFTGARYAPPSLTEAEIAFTESDAQSGAPNPPPPDLPDWLYHRFEASLGASAAAEAACRLRARAPITLRLNSRKTTRTDLIASLARDGIEAQPHPGVDTALQILSGARRLSQSRAYQAGEVDLQDAHSQAAMSCLDVKKGAQILDFCAGGGGKTLALAARLDANFFAYDVDPRRMKDLPARAHRAGIAVEVLSAEELERHAPYDLIVCDAPCSGSGTWRRTPDAKWTLSPDRLQTLCRMQAEILDHAARLTLAGGSIAYATCSVLREENEEQVGRFLANHPLWKPVFSQSWAIDEGGDGFFLSVLSPEHKSDAL